MTERKFAKNGQVRVVTHPRDVVDLEFNGWRELTDAPAPPKAGAGSDVESWRAFAEAQHVSVPDGASRGDIIAAVEGAGVPTVNAAD